MALETTRWDPVDYFEGPADQLLYLEAAFEDGDPAVIAAAIGDVARARGMSKGATDAGVTREEPYTTLIQGGDPRLSTLVGALKALGFSLSVVAREAEPLPG